MDMNTGTNIISVKIKLYYRKSFLRKVWRHKALLIMLIPALVYYITFKYVPLLGSVIAFKNYNIFKGFIASPWVGFKHFNNIFHNPDFYNIILNNLVISLYGIVFSFPAPILLALLLNEVKSEMFKRTVQTMVYLPHFISWSIIAGLAYMLLSSQTGIVNGILINMGFLKEPIAFLQKADYVRGIIVGSGIWKETGWSAIIYLATLNSISPSLYESAKIDGASRFKQCLYITIPGLAPAIVTLLLLKIGNILDLGFEHVFPFINGLTAHKAEVIDTFTYSMGVVNGQYSMTTAVGLFKSVIGLTLLLIANKISKATTEEGII
jgi:putative aldouronate transport system permease protein